MFRNVRYIFTFPFSQHFRHFCTMWINFPLIIHFLKDVENCGKPEYAYYSLIIYKFIRLWINFFSTIFMWILYIHMSKIENAS